MANPYYGIQTGAALITGMSQAYTRNTLMLADIRQAETANKRYEQERDYRQSQDLLTQTNLQQTRDYRRDQDALTQTRFEQTQDLKIGTLMSRLSSDKSRLVLAQQRLHPELRTYQKQYDEFQLQIDDLTNQETFYRSSLSPNSPFYKQAGSSGTSAQPSAPTSPFMIGQPTPETQDAISARGDQMFNEATQGLLIGTSPPPSFEIGELSPQDKVIQRGDILTEDSPNKHVAGGIETPIGEIGGRTDELTEYSNGVVTYLGTDGIEYMIGKDGERTNVKANTGVIQTMKPSEFRTAYKDTIQSLGQRLVTAMKASRRRRGEDPNPAKEVLGTKVSGEIQEFMTDLEREEGNPFIQGAPVDLMRETKKELMGIFAGADLKKGEGTALGDLIQDAIVPGEFRAKQRGTGFGETLHETITQKMDVVTAKGKWYDFLRAQKSRDPQTGKFGGAYEVPLVRPRDAEAIIDEVVKSIISDRLGQRDLQPELKQRVIDLKAEDLASNTPARSHDEYLTQAKENEAIEIKALVAAEFRARFNIGNIRIETALPKAIGAIKDRIGQSREEADETNETMRRLGEERRQDRIRQIGGRRDIRHVE